MTYFKVCSKNVHVRLSKATLTVKANPEAKFNSVFLLMCISTAFLLFSTHL